MSNPGLFAEDVATPQVITPSRRICLYDLHARERAGMPESWSIYRFEHKTPGGSIPPYTELTGAVAPLLLSGPQKGRPNWKKMDKSTERTVCVTQSEHDAWCEAWEARTGKCRKCVGEGTRPDGWSKAEGQRWRECRDCGGTGKAKAAQHGQGRDVQ